MKPTASAQDDEFVQGYRVRRVPTENPWFKAGGDAKIEIE
jgi:hypothetical protein